MQSLPWTYCHAIIYESLVRAAPLSPDNLTPSVSLVTEEWMPQVFHVRPNLVGTPCLQTAFHECDISKPLHHLVMCDSTLAYLAVGREHCHAQPVFRVSAYVSFYTSLVFHKVAPYQRKIAAVCRLVEELGTKTGFCLWGLGNDEKTAGVFVYAMYKSHFRIVRVIALHIPHMPCHSVYQCAMEISHTGMHHHAGRLVHDHHLVVLIDNIQRYVLWLYRRVVPWSIEHQRHCIAGLHLVIAFHGLTVNMDETGIGSFLYPVPAGMLQMLEQELIYTHGLLPLVGIYAEVFKELRGIVLYVFYIVNENVIVRNHNSQFVSTF